ncbi:acyl-CoA thioesterase [Rhizobium tumorigenes]|uniref:Thioesterase family protein n=1 Tax=Rhizobium tumorigenes TaxID=2041385 RepID=A0AAF1KW96_9HYPH|nr:thioesterase family protein [Rhizobium tumorigenes]WFR96219.1 thioesterase family protein [Rhizobium tumorigenes]WFS01736.1 thioesterase family protein [Rhizobium tumorigenes]
MPHHPTPTFEHHITISPGDIDQMGHVNNAVYLQWVQETIVSYWKHIAPIEARAGLLWVALKHDITYRAPLFLDDNVEALVTATETRGSRASFKTIFKRGKDVSAEVISSWCCIDAATRKPKRVARDLVRKFLPD